MKPFLLILFGLLLSGACRAEAPKTKEDFLAAVRAAFQAKDILRIHELTWEKGETDFDKAQAAQMIPMMLGQSVDIASISLGPLPPDFMDTRVAFGRRIDVTHPADGTVQIALKASDKNPTTSMSIPYAVIDGAWYLVTTKTSDLGWKGPQDKSLNVMVLGDGQDKVKIHVKYNASGVDLERDQLSPSEGFPGQYIREITVKSDSDDVNVTLSLMDNGAPYYKSNPLKGRGELHYTKGDTSPATP